MSKSPRKAIDHSAVAKTLKSLGLYTGKTTRLEKKDKDKINRAYSKFSYAANNPTSWKGVKVKPDEAKKWRERGVAVFKDRVMIYSKGFDSIKRTRAGDIVLANAEKSKRFTLTTDPTKLERLSMKHGSIGIQIGGVSIHRNFESWQDAVAYANQLRSRFAANAEKRDLVPLPVFVSGNEDEDSDE